MRSKLYVLFSMLLFTMCGCDNNKDRDIACQINASSSFEVYGYEVTHSLYIKKDESGFIWSLDYPNDFNNTFYFNFYYGDISLDNSEDFDYMTSTNDIVKVDDTYNTYDFTDSITICIYYSNVSKKVKDLVDNNTYDIEINSLKWFAELELFE